MSKYWLYVFITCLLEMVWVYGFSTAEFWWQWSLIIGVIMIDFYFLAKACEKLPTGTVYAIFAAIGSIGTVLMDAYVFGGSVDLLKLLFIGVLVAGVVGLKIADNQNEEGAVK